MNILNPWADSPKPIRLYVENYTVAGVKQADWYITPWDEYEKGRELQYASATYQLGMNTGYFRIICVSHSEYPKKYAEFTQ